MWARGATPVGQVDAGLLSSLWLIERKPGGSEAAPKMTMQLKHGAVERALSTQGVDHAMPPTFGFLWQTKGCTGTEVCKLPPTET